MSVAAGVFLGVMWMIELAKAEKKVWVAPALDELAIEKTLGGNVPFFKESQVSDVIPGMRGSYPG
jgi:hypothetical protein